MVRSKLDAGTAGRSELDAGTAGQSKMEAGTARCTPKRAKIFG